jgi:hypothetical protein
MPTFKSVVEASGAPILSPFEPPDAVHSEQDRELQEFVAGFRYTPPDESFDELTMRSELPVIDRHAPATPSHPSFDDDVPPPPEVGPHPTGQEYYPPLDPATGRSRFLDIEETHHSVAGQHPSAIAGASASGPGASQPSDIPWLDVADQPSRSRWLLWTSLFLLAIAFGSLGFLQGRAQIYGTNNGPIEVGLQLFGKLRQRFSARSLTAPSASSTDKSVAETSKPTEPPATSPTTDQVATPASNPESTNSTTSNPPAASGQQQPSPTVANPQSSPTADAPTAAKPSALTPATAQQQPSAIVAAAKPIEPPVPKSKSTHEPGQQELDKAMQASDPTAAAAWLWKSTSRGNPEAPVRLADLYIKGEGVPRSCEQALVLLRSAATKENAAARNRLAALYANGTCVPRDRVRAYQLMSSALVADPGSDWAQQNRKVLWNQMTPAERVEAVKYR